MFCSLLQDFHNLQTQLLRCVCPFGTVDVLLDPFLVTGLEEPKAHSHYYTLLWWTLCSLLSAGDFLPFPRQERGDYLCFSKSVVVCDTFGVKKCHASELLIVRSHGKRREFETEFGFNSTYRDWEGCPLGVLNETQYRPMLSPLIHTSPFPILVRFSVTASLPIGVANVVCVTQQMMLGIVYCCEYWIFSTRLWN